MDFYDVLGAPADASSDELKRAFRAKVREYHPDVNDHPDGDEQFKLVRTAHDVLSDPAERKDYDRMGHREYVDKRLDDLPPISVFPEAEERRASDTGSDATVDSSGSVGSEHSSPQRGTGSSTKKHTTSTSASSSRSSSSRSSSSSSTDNRTTGRSRSTGSSGSRSSNRSTGRSQSTTGSGSTGSGRSTNSNGTGESATGADRSWDDVTESARTDSTRSSTTAAATPRRRGLRRWYGVVLLSLLAYLAGVGSYAAPHAETLSGLATGLTSSPTATLTAAFPLPSPATYVLETATAAASGAPGVGLLFVVGAVAFPLVVLTVVAQYGHRGAWIYAVASLGPVVPLAAVRFAWLPTALALVGLVLLPLFSGLGFLVDVGRYLYATR